MASNAEYGTPKAHYAGPEDGPFECAKCVHFRWPHMCDHPDVIADAKDGKLPIANGKAQVRPKGCCNYFRPEGK